MISPSTIAKDRVFFTALLTSPADVEVTIGGTVVSGATWENVPSSGQGLYHGSVEFGNLVGPVSVVVSTSVLNLNITAI